MEDKHVSVDATLGTKSRGGSMEWLQRNSSYLLEVTRRGNLRLGFGITAGIKGKISTSEVATTNEVAEDPMP